MRDAFGDEIRQRRRIPADDFISALISAEENGRKLTEEEIISTCQLTLTAGNDTTTNPNVKRSGGSFDCGRA